MKIKRFSQSDFPLESVQLLLKKIYLEKISQPSFSLLPYQIEYLKSWITIFDHQDECVAVTALFHNSHCQDCGDEILFAGFFACIHSKDVMQILTDGIRDFAKEFGFKKIVGPMNATTWDSYRFAENPGKASFFLDVIHPNYYPILWSSVGWKPCETYHSTKARIQDVMDGMAELKPFHNSNVEINPLDIAHFDDEIQSIYQLSVKSFQRNRFYSEIPFTAFFQKYKQLERLFNPEFVLIAKDHEQTVGFIFCIPDILDSTGKTMIIKSLAIQLTPEYKGLGSYLTRLIYLKAASQFEFAIHALMHQSNTSAMILSKSHEVIQHYYLYELIV